MQIYSVTHTNNIQYCDADILSNTHKHIQYCDADILSNTHTHTNTYSTVMQIYSVTTHTNTTNTYSTVMQIY